MRLTLVIDSLEGGGAQRVLSTMANYWAAQGWFITLLTLDDGRQAPFYPLDARVEYWPLGTARPLADPLTRLLNKPRHVLVLRRAIRQSRPQAVISFIDRVNVLTLLATRGLGLPVIVSERVDPALYSIGPLWECLREWTYLHADRLVAQSEAALQYFAPAVRRKGCVIPNPVGIRDDLPRTGEMTTVQRPLVVLGMGRLRPQKGFDLLLRAFAAVAPAYPEWSLEIWGEGSERPALEQLRRDFNLQSQVRLPGQTTQPFDKMRTASLFVLSSRFDGFPNVLCEAMACGLPVISFDCPSGPRVIIRDGVDGLLVPVEDVGALAEALACLMGNANERQRLAARAPEVLERFGIEKVMGMWESLLEQTLDESA